MGAGNTGRNAVRPVGGNACSSGSACIPPIRDTDGKGNTVQTTDSKGRQSNFGFDDKHNIVAQQNIFGKTAYYGYDSTHRTTVQVSMRWPESNAADFTSYYNYDDHGNMTSFVNPLKDVATAQFQRGGLAVARQDQRGNTEYYDYDSAGRRTQVLAADSGSAYFSYDIYANTLKHVQPRWLEGDTAAFTTYFAYDSHNRPTRIKGPEGTLAYFDYASRCAEGPIHTAQWVDGAFRETTAHYDGVARMDRFQDAVGGTSYFAYAGFSGLITEWTNPRGFETYYAYDGVNRLIATLDPLNNSTYYVYDLQSVAVIDPRWQESSASNFTTYYFYDAPSIPAATLAGADFTGPRSRLMVQVDALRGSTYYNYDNNANRTTQVMPRWTEGSTDAFTWYYRYDTIDRQDASLDPRGGTTYYHFDPCGNISAMQDARFNTTYYGYDSTNRLSAQLDVIGGATYFGYDVAGNTIRSEDALQHTSYFGFDALNRNNQTLDPIGASTYFGYNQAGDMLRSVGPRWQESSAGDFTSYYGYDAMSRRTATLDPLGFSTYFVYDGNGNVIAQLSPNWAEYDDPIAWTTYYGYDALNRVVAELAPATRSAVPMEASYFAYDAAGNRTAVVTPQWQQSGGHPLYLFTTYYAYDALNRMSAILDPLLQSSYFGYDANGNRDRVVSARWAESTAAAFTTYYRFDNLDRQVALRTPLGYSAYFGYDAVGNQTSVTGPRWAESAPLDFTKDRTLGTMRRAICCGCRTTSKAVHRP
jgi:YD repeat-containing protein